MTRRLRNGSPLSAFGIELPLNKIMKLKIIYESKKRIQPFIDKVLTATLKKLGFEEKGSGYNFESKKRDISFEHKKV